jgi:predicted metal-dependent enzyme (double-stranded beta helix superfamily)
MGLAGLEDLIAFIDSELRSFMGLKEIENLLSQFTVRPDDFARYVVPDGAHYHRERLIQTDFASLYILTWLPGQESPIHDHRASRCGVRVLTGEMFEAFYRLVPGTENKVRRTSVNRWQPGVVTSAEQGIGIHKVANKTRDTTLVTLHFYSPPLLQMNVYTKE